MSGDAVKAYMYLLSESWLSVPRATLPNDDHELASLARLKYDDFIAIKSEIISQFKIGKCNEHKGLLYNETLLEISRKSESKQRLGNKNAKRTQNKRKTNANINANPENENAVEIENKSDNERKILVSNKLGKQEDCTKFFNFLTEQRGIDRYLVARYFYRASYDARNSVVGYVLNGLKKENDYYITKAIPAEEDILHTNDSISQILGEYSVSTNRGGFPNKPLKDDLPFS